MNFTINGVSGSKIITRQIFATEPVQSGRFPFEFKGIRLNSMAFNPLYGIICQATLSFTNLSAVTLSPAVSFDVIVDGAVTGQVPFFSSGLAPGATATATSQPIVNNGSYLTCGTFTLQFNSSGSQVR